MKRLLLILSCIVPLSAHSQNEWTLQKWTEVKGTVGGEKLGTFVSSVPQNSNLPFKVAVSKSGSTSFFRLQTSADTVAVLSIAGESPLFGDLNNDGFLDVVVIKSVNDYDTVYVYWGTATGLDTLSPLKIPSENRFDVLRPSCVGDINNDGKPDLILTAGGFPGGLQKGKIYVYLNPVNSISPSTTTVGDSVFTGLGVTSVIADLNNDGLNDLVVRGWNQSGPQASRYDYVNVYWGTGLNVVNLTLGLQLRGFNLNSRGLACFDVNGDRIPDLLWTNRDSASVPNQVFIHFGGSAFSSLPSLKLQNPGVANFGNIIINPGDMNGDGYNDIVVAAAEATITSGFIFVFSGGPYIDGKYDGAVGLSTDAWFGWSVSAVRDVNGDGLSDLIVGAPQYDFGSGKGYWAVFLGDRRIPTLVEKTEAVPKEFDLFQNYPNPFNPRTTIEFRLQKAGHVLLDIYDSLGREIRRLVDENFTAGEHIAEWDGKNSNAQFMTSGPYFYRLTVDGKALQTKKLILLK